MDCGEIKKAYYDQQIVCVQLKNTVERYLVGIIEAYERDGIILYNIDYRGIATCYVYLSMEKISDICNYSAYIEKIRIILAENLVIPSQRLFEADKKEIKEEFLQWLHKNHKLIRITFEDEQLEGYIERIFRDFISIKIIDEFTGRSNGHTFIKKNKMLFFDTKVLI